MLQLSPERTLWAIHLPWAAARRSTPSTRPVPGSRAMPGSNWRMSPICPAPKPSQACRTCIPENTAPFGCSVLADRIHPLLVGSDIGCGMGLFQLVLAVRKLRVDKAASRLRALDASWEGSIAELLAEVGLAPTP